MTWVDVSEVSGYGKNAHNFRVRTLTKLVGIEINKTWHPVSLCDLRARIARFYGPIRG